jgi:CrcB protein
MELIFIGVGGALGSLARYGLGRWIAKTSKSAYPAGTFLINITGAVLLGLLGGLNLTESISLLLADGFLGAYTTFSTFMYEGFRLFRDSKVKNAVAYIVSTLALGVLGYFIGYYLGGILR